MLRAIRRAVPRSVDHVVHEVTGFGYRVRAVGSGGGVAADADVERCSRVAPTIGDHARGAGRRHAVEREPLVPVAILSGVAGGCELYFHCVADERVLVRRKVFAEVPPRVEYTLTQEGASLGPIVTAMGAWGKAYGRRSAATTTTTTTTRKSPRASGTTRKQRTGTSRTSS